MSAFISNQELGSLSSHLLEALFALKLIRDWQTKNPKAIANEVLQDIGVK